MKIFSQELPKGEPGRFLAELVSTDNGAEELRINRKKKKWDWLEKKEAVGGVKWRTLKPDTS